MAKILTKHELAKEFKVHVNTIDKWRKNGMPDLKVGKSVRFDLDDVIAWFKDEGR